MAESNTSRGGNATLVQQRIREAVETIQTEGEFTNNRESVTFAQPTVLPTNEFANMNTTPYAWARAFPTVFMPVYVQFKGEMRWVILNDITGSHGTREKSVSIHKWYNYMMWRSDGIPSSHPTFSLVLYNHKMRNSLQSQGRFTINTSDIDPTITLDTIRNARCDNNALQIATEDLLKRAHMHASNIPGTMPYWKSTRYEFKAINFFNSYIKKRDISLFHTGSLAEYHEYPLRHLLYKYTTALSHVDEEYSLSILNDDSVFMNAVQKYKNIVTHYLASKMELWMGLFMKPVYKVDHGVLTKEFAKTRGAIHFHSLLGQGGNECSRKLNENLQRLALSINEAMERLNSYIRDSYDGASHGRSFETRPDLVFDSTGEKLREDFCSLTDEGKQHWNAYILEKSNAMKIAGGEIGRVMESEYGHSALHLGNAPEDWVKPGGLRSDGYRETCSGMQASTDVLERKELKRLKVNRENDLVQRQLNMMNHCGTHRCSGYCLQEKPFYVNYDPTIHTDTAPEDRIVTLDGTEKVRIKVHECRHRFGKALKFDSSGENNLTRGIPPQMHPCITFDKNGQPRYLARRNHPRILQQPYSFTWYGANNDTQQMLINATSQSTLSILGSAENYEKYHCNLSAAGVQGLEHHTGLDMVEEYGCSYSCKGGENSANWQSVSRTITEEYCARPGNGDRSIRSLVAKHMNEISKNMSVTRDQSQFLLGGGSLKRSSVGTPLKCSVSSMDVSELANDERECPNNFQWHNIQKRYRERPIELEHENLYTYCALHWHTSGPKPIQFFGFHDKATWPLDETYAKWMLTFFKPWRENIDTLKGVDGTFVTTLEQFMYDPQFPARKRAEIQRAKRIQDNFDASEGAHMHPGGGDDFSPTVQQRENAAFEESAVNALSPPTGEDDNDDFEDMTDRLFSNIDSRIPPDFDWSENLVRGKANWLINFAKNFYKERNESIISTDAPDVEEELVLFDEDVYRPENCRGEDQVFLIYHHLLVQYQIHLFQNGEIENRPPCAFVLVEGLPGTGKSFVTKTLRNITRKIHGRNSADMASAPTGCAASLIGGSTHCRCSHIPTGRKFKQIPTNMTTSDSTVMRATRLSMSKVVSRFMDEHSMDGRPTWAWLKHRHEELRRPSEVLDTEAPTLVQEVIADNLLDPDVYMRPWGGIAFVYSFGDCGQLPPVMMKAMYDQSPGRPGTADYVGRIAFSEFRSPPDPEQAVSISVVMDEVLRQDDETFKRLLTRMHEGNIQDEDVDFLLGRCLDKLPHEERSSFEQNALHLVPTWKLTHQIVFEYLQSFDTPVAKFKARLQSIRSNGTNHCVKETSYPIQNALCVGAVVMLLRNFVVEYGLMNGSIGIVREIVYESKEGPNGSSFELPIYMVVEFTHCTIGSDVNGQCFEDKPLTWIPIPVVKDHCDKKCCSIETIPLRVCIAITIYKSQGMTIGPGQQFEKVIVYLPEAGTRSIPGLELVGISRAMSPDCLAIGNNSSSFSEFHIKKIGTSAAYDARRLFEQEMKDASPSTQLPIREDIKNLDPCNDKSFEGGCDFLLKWYRDNF